MPYNGKILGRANARLADIREKNAAEQNRRLKSVYAAVPEIEQIDGELRAQVSTLLRLAVSHDSGRDASIASLREENLSLQMKRAELLVEHGYPIDWLDDVFSCPRCKDTGRLEGGAMCSCLEALYNKELSAELSTLLRSGSESFESFDLSLYPGEYSDFYKCIPRSYMKKVLDYCRSYAASFPKVEGSLLLHGDSGLGKTFISACIAREVVQKGYSVFYDTAVSVFSAFEIQQFSRNTAEGDAAAEKVRRMLDCDLMILDDLGTEVPTPMVQSALYTLINTRCTAGRPIIINTTVFPEDLSSRYGASVASRINGWFKAIVFVGDDIRAILKNSGNATNKTN